MLLNHWNPRGKQSKTSSGWASWVKSERYFTNLSFQRQHCTGIGGNQRYSTYLRHATPARLTAQFAGRWGKRIWNRVRWGKKLSCTRPTRAAKAVQKSLVSVVGTKSPTNQPRRNPFHLYSVSPHLRQFQQSTGATPLNCLSRGNHLL